MITQVIQPHGAFQEASDSLVEVGGGGGGDRENLLQGHLRQESELVSVRSDLTA